MTPDELKAWQNEFGLTFKEFYERHIWGPEDEHKTRKCINQTLIREGFKYDVWPRDNFYFGKEDPYGTWKAVLECGKSYLCGENMPMKEFLKKHRTNLNGWQRIAFAWCHANPKRELELNTRRGTGFAKRTYVIRLRGEYVEIGLPHQDAGGEKHWVSKDGKSKILVNVD